ncbi:MAG TPA: cytochrome P450 [Alphaproteobacteria bacterium]|nr:cytochrome P450 [Alphaproteobacteria bacterium]
MPRRGGDDAEALVSTLLDWPFVRDPYPVASRLRDVAPVYRTNRGFWLASDAASVEQLYRSPTMRIGFDTVRIEQGPRFADSPSLQLFKRMLPFMDPPDHTRIRRALAPYFTPRVMAGLRRYAEDLVDRLLDRLEANGGGDLVYDFANDIPVAVVCHLLGGVGEEDQIQCREWAEGLVEAVHPECTDEMQRNADAAAVAFGGYAEHIIADKDGSDEDLVSCLVREHRQGNLDMQELVGTVTTLIGAAFHNTRNHIASGIYELLRHRDQLALLQRDPDLAPLATEELLRYDPPVQMTIPRITTADVVMGDVTIGPGELVAGLISGANRDPARYSDPDRLDIQRDEGGSISFAAGIHSCIGIVMARMEAQVAIGRFVQRFSSAQLIDEDPEVELHALPLTRGYRQIRISL